MMNCPADDCLEEIDLATFACRRHWRMLSFPLRDRVYSRWHGTLDIDYDDLVAEANHEWAGR